MKLIASGVIFSAAIVRSPSFSRSSSSTTITMRPSRIAAIASSTRANGPAVRAREPLAISMWRFISVSHFPRAGGREGQPRKFGRVDNVFGNHVALQIDAIARLPALKVRVRHRERHDLHVEAIRAESGHRQA